MDSISLHIFQLVILLFSVVIHEVSHGLMALRLGDETAKRAGRLTLNPISHLDPIGSFLVPLLLLISGLPILGWAKPVPYNPNALYKDYRFGPLKVALIGPASNLIIAVIFGAIVRFGLGYLNTTLIALLGFIVFLNILLAVFNLLPIPPLDGSKILTTFLPPAYAMKLERLGFMGILIVLVFLYFFFGIIFTITQFVFNLIVGAEGAAQFFGLLG